MLPFLALTALGSLTWLVPAPPGPYGRLLLLLAVAVLGVGGWLALTALGRRAPRPTRVTTAALLAAYAALPALVPVLVVAGYGSGRAEQVLRQPAGAAVASFAGVHLLAFVAAWLVTAYGLVPLFAAVTVLAAAARLRDEIGRVEQDLSPPRLSAACRETPLADVPLVEIVPDGALPARPGGGAAGRLRQYVLCRDLDERQRAPAAVLRADPR